LYIMHVVLPKCMLLPLLFLALFFFFSITPHPPLFILFPYTTLFRSFCTLVALALVRQVLKGPSRCSWFRRRSAPPHSRLFAPAGDRKSTRLNSSHLVISYAVFCLKKKTADAGLRVVIDAVYNFEPLF